MITRELYIIKLKASLYEDVPQTTVSYLVSLVIECPSTNKSIVDQYAILRTCSADDS